MPKDAKQLAQLAQLRDLAHRPDEQVRLALDLLDRERGVAVVAAALRIVARATRAEAAPVLRRLYAYYAAAGIKRDAGASQRVAILAALQPRAEPADQALAEAAAATYEYMPPGHVENASALRAAGLLLLNDLDAETAAYASVRLLVDPYSERMSGEPAVSAARLLAARRHMLPLYAYVVQPAGTLPEVVAECLKGLVSVPAPVLAQLVAQLRETPDDLILVALLDLILAHADRGTYCEFISRFLGTTRRYDVYQYLVTTMIATRRDEMLPLVLAAGAEEYDPRKVAILLDALPLARGDAAAVALASELAGRV